MRKNRLFLLLLLLVSLFTLAACSQGAQGEAGDKGEVGDKGITGDTGATGDKGADGKDSKAPEFKIDNDGLQWRFEGDEEWNVLITIPDLIGYSEKYTISFDTNGGDALEALGNQVWKSTAELPVATKDDYTFLGWQKIEEGALEGDVYAENKYPNVQGDVELKAVWGATVSYAEETAKESVVLKAGESTTLPTIEAPEGKTFLGWSYDGYTLEAAGAEVVPTTNRHYVPVYNYTITYELNGGEGAASEDVATAEIGKLQTPTKAGHVFQGWYKDAEFTQVVENKPVGDITLYAKWVEATYVNYNLNGGTFAVVPYASFDAFVEEFLEDFNTVGSVNVTAAGFADGSGTAIKTTYGNAEFLAKWSWLAQLALDEFNAIAAEKGYTDETKMPSGGTMAHYKQMLTDIVAGDTTAISGDNYPDARTCFRQFIQRLINKGDASAPGKTPYNDYTVDYSDPAKLSEFKALLGLIKQVMFAESGALATPRRDGYIFAGWFDDQGNKVESVTIGDGKTTINVTAKWQATHTVSFDLDGGAFAKAPVGDALYTIAVNVYKNGWSDDKPQFGDVAIKDAGSTYVWAPKVFLVYHADINAYEVVEKAPADGASSIQGATSAWTHCLLYVSDAEYEKIQVGQYLVADAEISVGCAPFNLNAYAEFAAAPTNVVYTEDIAALPVPTKEGFIFVGWFNGETKVEAITIGTKSETYTLVAKWQSAELTKIEINNAFSSGSYITDDASYPDPAYYSNGGLKMTQVNMGVLTDKFEAQSAVEVTLNILALNDNKKSENSTETDAFTVYGLNEAGEVVATASTNAIAVGDVTVELAGEGIVQVKVIMTDYFNNGTKCVNVNLGAVIVK